MGVYTRFKRNPGGFRQLVELLETTPQQRRLRMIEVGMAEDRDFTERAMEYMMTFEDVMKLPDLELAEVVAKAPPKIIACAIHRAPEDVRARFLRNSKPQIAAEIRSCLEMAIGVREIGGAQLKMIETARGLERLGRVRTKRIPN